MKLASLAGKSVVELVNQKSQALKAVKVDTAALTEEAAADLISTNPRIMIRPLLTNGKQVALGFDPAQMERVLMG